MRQAALTATSPRLSYFVEGQGEEPVLLIMGFGMPGEAWRPQIEGLADRYRLVYFDARGIGDSDPVDGKLTMASMAQDALRVLDDAGFERAHLVGVSMGGMVAQELALAAPDRFWSLSLIATHAGGPLTWLPRAGSLWRMFLSNLSSPRKRLEHLEELLYPAEYRRTCDRAALERRMQACFSVQPAPATMSAQLSAVMGHRTAKRLRDLRLPTLVIRAGQDRMVAPQHVERLASLLPDARLVEFEDAGHGLVFQHAEAINEALRGHFEAQSPRRMDQEAG